MLLPKKHLELISYWEEESYLPILSGRWVTKVTIHYNAWYKLPKSFVFKWMGDEGGWMHQPESAAELIQQLKQL
jgi:hypothetical protein